MIYLDRELEIQKIELLKQADFNLMDLFKQFDSQTIIDPENDAFRSHQAKGQLCQQDLKKCLTDIYRFDPNRLSSSILSLLFLHYTQMDANIGQYLFQPMSFVEFCHLLLPANQEFAEILLSRQERYMHVASTRA